MSNGNNIENRYKIIADTALKEMHNIDKITEQHAGIIMALMAAIFAFIVVAISQGKISNLAVYVVSGLGIVLAGELGVKAWRHRNIFLNANDTLKKVEEKIIPNKKECQDMKLSRTIKKWWNGFMIIAYLAGIFILFWGAMIVFTVNGRFIVAAKVSSERFYKVETYKISDLAKELEKKVREGWIIEGIHPQATNFTIVSYKDKK
jgi:hypothetical protein